MNLYLKIGTYAGTAIAALTLGYLGRGIIEKAKADKAKNTNDTKN
jgi:hypothetical protein